MRFVFRSCVGVTALVVLAVSSFGQGAKTGKVAEASLRTRLLAGPYVQGKFSKVDVKGDDKQLVLTHVHQTKKAKPASYRKYHDAAMRYNAALNRRNTSLEEIKKLKSDVERAGKGVFDEMPVSFDLKITSKTLLRFQKLPPNPDGSPKVMSAAELARLKGDPRLPGYVAKLTDLNKTDIVQVTIDKANIKKSENGTTYPVKMIVIVPTFPEDEFQPIPLK